tara:strand:+ start:1656 stop:2159 length:504 start_codon:yes stop_codon:yes gene_type:complete
MKVPYTNFKIYLNDEWAERDTVDIFDNKKVVVFAVPGAFTLSSGSQQLIGYEKNYEAFKKLGVDEVYCLAVNDTFVMDAWFKQLNAVNVKPIGDGEGVFTQGMGMLVNKPKQGFGMRSWRYSMLVDNGEIVKQFVEQGQNNSSDDNDPLDVSDPQTMLDFIKNIAEV